MNTTAIHKLNQMFGPRAAGIPALSAEEPVLSAFAAEDPVCSSSTGTHSDDCPKPEEGLLSKYHGPGLFTAFSGVVPALRRPKLPEVKLNAIEAKAS